MPDVGACAHVGRNRLILVGYRVDQASLRNAQVGAVIQLLAVGPVGVASHLAVLGKNFAGGGRRNTGGASTDAAGAYVDRSVVLGHDTNGEIANRKALRVDNPIVIGIEAGDVR